MEVELVLSSSLFSSLAQTLVIVLPNVIENGSNEFKTWWFFAVAIVQNKDRALALERIRNRMDDITMCGWLIFIQNDSSEVVKNICWKIIVINEFYEYKNGKLQSYETLEELKNTRGSPLMWLNGTVVSNKFKEMRRIVNIVQAGVLIVSGNLSIYIYIYIYIEANYACKVCISIVIDAFNSIFFLTIIYSSLVESFFSLE